MEFNKKNLLTILKGLRPLKKNKSKPVLLYIVSKCNKLFFVAKGYPDIEYLVSDNYQSADMELVVDLELVIDYISTAKFSSVQFQVDESSLSMDLGYGVVKVPLRKSDLTNVYWSSTHAHSELRINRKILKEIKEHLVKITPTVPLYDSIGGINFLCDMEADVLYITATDGVGLISRRVEGVMCTGAKSIFSETISNYDLARMDNCVGKNNNNIVFHFNDNKKEYIAYAGKYTFSGNTLGSDYPDFKSIVLQDISDNLLLKLNRFELIKKLKAIKKSLQDDVIYIHCANDSVVIGCPYKIDVFFELKGSGSFAPNERLNASMLLKLLEARSAEYVDIYSKESSIVVIQDDDDRNLITLMGTRRPENYEKIKY